MSEKKYKLSDFNINVSYETLGEYLKESRLLKKATLSDVFNTIRIRENFIEALENNQYDLLPERTYALGYLRSYANFLELPNVEKLVQYLDKTYHFNDPVYSEDDFYGNQPQSQSDVKNKKVKIAQSDSLQNKQQNLKTNTLQYSKYYFLGSILFVCFIAIFIFVSFFSKSEEEVADNVNQQISTNNQNINVADSNNFTKVDKENMQDQQQIDQNINTQQNQQDKNKENEAKNVFTENSEQTDIVIQRFPQETIPRSISLIIKEKVWIQIYNSDNPTIVYLDKIFEPQDVYNIPGVENISMRIGNYKALDLKIDGISYPLTSNKKNTVVLNNISLDKRNLLNLYGNN